MSEDSKERGLAGDDHHHHHHHLHHHRPEHDQQQLQYGTFQGVANYPPHPQPVIGFPQPVPPPGITASSLPPGSEYDQGYQTVPGYAVTDGSHVREGRLSCCGCGMGWFLFIIGFFLAAIPWYIGAFVILCIKTVDIREKPGYVACTIAAGIATVAIVFGATANKW
ncbi:60S ribosomal protein L18a-like protein [Impatiens glandulifera]|uniref:60S ribosomal protein L18a-like protein n=1 Tax=Impatiens glandulifera TaxID=253017 RepID=UPI001FB114B8|nr:60S ribosomal protein L18a-like protein [Impatiens glandulifera]